MKFHYFCMQTTVWDEKASSLQSSLGNCFSAWSRKWQLWEHFAGRQWAPFNVTRCSFFFASLMYLSLPGTEKESIQVIPKFQIGKLEKSDYQTVWQPMVWNGHSVNDSFSKHVSSTCHALATVRDSRDGATHQIYDLILTTISGSKYVYLYIWNSFENLMKMLDKHTPPEKFVPPHTWFYVFMSTWETTSGFPRGAMDPKFRVIVIFQ